VTEFNRGLGALVENAQRVSAVALDELGGGKLGQAGPRGMRSEFRWRHQGASLVQLLTLL
jgi:hypothetical protein